MGSDQYRRRFLQVTGGAGITALAGCTRLSNLTDDEEESNDQGTADADIEPEDGVVTQVGPGEMEMQQIQEEVMVEAEEEGWSDEELQQEMNRRFEERVGEDLDSFEEWAAGQEEIAVAGRIDQMGLVLLDGTDKALMSALRSGEIGILAPGTDFADAQESLGLS